VNQTGLSSILHQGDPGGGGGEGGEKKGKKRKEGEAPTAIRKRSKSQLHQSLPRKGSSRKKKKKKEEREGGRRGGGGEKISMCPMYLFLMEAGKKIPGDRGGEKKKEGGKKKEEGGRKGKALI